jgi:hypothetical protein
MIPYRIAGNDYLLSCSISGLERSNKDVAELTHTLQEMVTVPVEMSLLCENIGLVGGEHRRVEVWSVPPAFLLRVAGGSDFYISHNGRAILRVTGPQTGLWRGEIRPVSTVSALDNEILIGPALVLALALRNTWSLHASAAMFKNKTIAFVGESGRGKSTLATYLNNSNWRRVADDMLPVTFNETTVQAWPHFPQLKLPMDKQPWLNLPEHVSLERICVLTHVDKSATPDLEIFSPSHAVRVMIGHTAGTRLFDQGLLANHLDFCVEAAKRIPVYRLSYPHRKDVLPEIKYLLENLC